MTFFSGLVSAAVGLLVMTFHAQPAKLPAGICSCALLAMGLLGVIGNLSASWLR